MVSKARLIRQQRNLILRELSINIGCHESQISNFEHGRWALPSKWREPLASELNVKISDIMDERGLALWIEE